MEILLQAIRILSFILILYSGFSDEIDVFTSSQSVSEGRTLVSRDGNFELGFFSHGTSMNRYLGIWFKKIPVQTVVWVSNRHNPIKDSYCSTEKAILYCSVKAMVLFGQQTQRK
ncbi:hypothetical protein CRYUN_Cryun11dG0041000 [Craigia yunnanensis]